MLASGSRRADRGLQRRDQRQPETCKLATSARVELVRSGKSQVERQESSDVGIGRGQRRLEFDHGTLTRSRTGSRMELFCPKASTSPESFRISFAFDYRWSENDRRRIVSSRNGGRHLRVGLADSGAHLSSSSCRRRISFRDRKRVSFRGFLWTPRAGFFEAACDRPVHDPFEHIQGVIGGTGRLLDCRAAGVAIFSAQVSWPRVSVFWIRRGLEDRRLS